MTNLRTYANVKLHTKCGRSYTRDNIGDIRQNISNELYSVRMPYQTKLMNGQYMQEYIRCTLEFVNIYDP